MRLWLVTTPVFLVLAYALLQLMGNAFSELRDVVFAYLTQSTVAAFMERTFAERFGAERGGARHQAEDGAPRQHG